MELIKYDDKRTIETLKQTVAIGATDAEFLMFIEFCKSTGLNPFKKELWFIKAGGRVQIMTGINGFMSIANSHPQYDGMTVEVDNDEDPQKATCKVYRKDRKYPTEGVALMKEYKKSGPTWSQMPRTMLTKVAKSIALREAFTQELGGLYTAEEMPAEYSNERPVQVVQLEKMAVTVPTPEPTWYAIPEPTREQRLFLEKRGCTWDEVSGTWACPMDLGKKLEAFRVEHPPVEVAEATEGEAA